MITERLIGLIVLVGGTAVVIWWPLGFIRRRFSARRRVATLLAWAFVFHPLALLVLLVPTQLYLYGEWTLTALICFLLLLVVTLGEAGYFLYLGVRKLLQ